jgi:hypothetical protein
MGSPPVNPAASSAPEKLVVCEEDMIGNHILRIWFLERLKGAVTNGAAGKRMLAFGGRSPVKK